MTSLCHLVINFYPHNAGGSMCSNAYWTEFKFSMALIDVGVGVVGATLAFIILELISVRLVTTESFKVKWIHSHL